MAPHSLHVFNFVFLVALAISWQIQQMVRCLAISLFLFREEIYQTTTPRACISTLIYKHIYDWNIGIWWHTSTQQTSSYLWRKKNTRQTLTPHSKRIEIDFYTKTETLSNLTMVNLFCKTIKFETLCDQINCSCFWTPGAHTHTDTIVTYQIGSRKVKVCRDCHQLFRLKVVEYKLGEMLTAMQQLIRERDKSDLEVTLKEVVDARLSWMVWMIWPLLYW